MVEDTMNLPNEEDEDPPQDEDPIEELRDGFLFINADFQPTCQMMNRFIRVIATATGGETQKAIQALLQDGDQVTVPKEGKDRPKEDGGTTLADQQPPLLEDQPLQPLQEQQPGRPVQPPVRPLPAGPPVAPAVFKPKLETHFNGSADHVSHFVVAVTTFLNFWAITSRMMLSVLSI